MWYRIGEFQRVSLQIIAEALLLQMPSYSRRPSLPLNVPGDVRRQTLAFTKPVLLWASPVNAGASVLADELADTFPSLSISKAAAAGQATHMLLYLNRATWSNVGEQLLRQVKQAREAGLPIVMAHEQDPEKDSCAFDVFFQTTPQELLQGGIYNDLARSLLPGVYREARACLAFPGGCVVSHWHAARNRFRSSLSQRTLVPLLSKNDWTSNERVVLLAQPSAPFSD